ncbi:MAG: c-type cytochrome [Acidiferrobacterales bacterium]
MSRAWIAVIVGTLLLVACEKQSEKAEQAAPEPQEMPVATAPAAPEPKQSFSVENIKRGAALYREHCLQCHGPEAQGHPDWQTTSDGTFTAAPPLNGTGNAWKRKKQDMIAIIKNGLARNGVPAMPAWKGRLSDEEIEDIITWFQVLWPPDVYERWLKANMGTAAPTG